MSDDECFAGFDGIVASLDELREIVGDPTPKVLAKELDALDDICRDFIARSPFCLLATVGAPGHIDVSPKGDPAGFVRVLDDTHLAIPDRPGNRRVDGFRNLLDNPKVGLIFLIPGKGETLRINGEARIVRDDALRRSMAVEGKVPDLALVVHVERAFMHCPKAMVRSAIWQPEAWPDSSAVPDIGRAMIAHGHLPDTPEELQAEADAKGWTRLY